MNLNNSNIVLSYGGHEPEDGAACVMELLALLTNDEWTDQPACTHVQIAKLAQQVNDLTYGSTRQQLLEPKFLNRIYGTNELSDKEFAEALIELMDTKYISIFDQRDADGKTSVTSRGLAQKWIESAKFLVEEETYDPAISWCMSAFMTTGLRGLILLEVLDDVLTIADRLLGRDSIPMPFSEEDFERIHLVDVDGE